MLAPLLLLCFLLALLCRSLQIKLRNLIAQNPSAIFFAPIALTGIFCMTAFYYQCLSWLLALLIAAYTVSPTTVIYSGRIRPSDPSRASLLDFSVILMLWLPLEFSAGAGLIPRPVQPVLHATAYGVAVTLGVILFLLVRRFDGMKYRLPTRLADARNIVVGYVVSAVLLIPLGLVLGFLGKPHWPRLSLQAAFLRLILIFFGTAFPEEILFRALIQNWFTQRLAQSWKALVVSALIFGASHLDNGPGALPNWRYMAMATVAGLIFGTVFLRSTSVLTSAAVHAGVNLTVHVFF